MDWDLKQRWIAKLNAEPDRQCRNGWFTTETVAVPTINKEYFASKFDLANPLSYLSYTYEDRVAQVCALASLLEMEKPDELLQDGFSKIDYVKALGVTPDQMLAIVKMNDNEGKTFGEIAKWIDENIPSDSGEILSDN